jgi:regulator of protease activity HflC (stomatin/prohibitin superfamily)
MGKNRVFGGLGIFLITTLAWNFFHPQYDMGQISPLHVSLKAFLLIAVIWYAVCWVNIVDQRDRRPVMLFGKYVRTLGPGLSLLEPLFYRTLEDVNVQDDTYELEVPEVQTKDNVGISLIGLLTYCADEDRVKEFIVNVVDGEDSLGERGLSTLTDVTAKQNLDDLLENRDQFCALIKDELASRSKDWGFTVKAFELKALVISDKVIAEAIAMKARAAKEGAAELTRADFQLQVAKKLNEAADAYTEKGRWLKGMETMLELCRSGQNNTILIPTDLTEALARSKTLFPAA